MQILGRTAGVAETLGGWLLVAGLNSAQASVLEDVSGEPPLNHKSGEKQQATATSGLTILAAGSTSTGGWVTFSGTGTMTVDDDDLRELLASHGVEGVSGPQAATVKAGGGTWSYGATSTIIGQKTCYSQYQHPTKSHGASVKMDGYADSGVKDPNVLASARITRYTRTTCSAYWRTS